MGKSSSWCWWIHRSLVGSWLLSLNQWHPGFCSKTSSSLVNISTSATYSCSLKSVNWSFYPKFPVFCSWSGWNVTLPLFIFTCINWKVLCCTFHYLSHVIEFIISETEVGARVFWLIQLLVLAVSMWAYRYSYKPTFLYYLSLLCQWSSFQPAPKSLAFHSK